MSDSIFTLHLETLLGQSNQGGWDWQGMDMGDEKCLQNSGWKAWREETTQSSSSGFKGTSATTAICACVLVNTHCQSMIKCSCKIYHPAHCWWCLTGRTFGTWQYILGSLWRCVWHTRGVGWWTEDGCVWYGCGQPTGGSPQHCHSEWSDSKKTSIRVPLASYLAASCPVCAPSPVAIWPR
jgi:hypothetical protein